MSIYRWALLAARIGAQEEERRTIACDLHDGIVQYILASCAHLEAAQALRDTGDCQSAEQETDSALELLRKAVVEARCLMNGLRTPDLDELGLVGALEQLLIQEKRRAGWSEVELIHNLTDHCFDRTLEAGVFRIVQEAVTNVRKHANTKRVAVAVLARSGMLTLHVRDWGRGVPFVAPRERTTATGMGLISMAERIRLFRGRLEIRRAPGGGAIVRAVLPLVKEDRRISDDR